MQYKIYNVYTSQCNTQIYRTQMHITQYTQPNTHIYRIKEQKNHFTNIRFIFFIILKLF